LSPTTARIAVGLLAASALTLGCAGRADTPTDHPVVDFAISDGALSGPDTVLAGWTTMRLAVADGHLDQVALVRLEAGHTMAEFLTATEVAYPPFWAHFAGGVSAVAPGGTGEVLLELQPGDWLALAFDTGPDGFPRLRHQLFRPFTVVAGSAAVAPAPAPFQLALFDYGFLISAPLVVGTQVVEVTNLAPQRHEAILVELPAGETADAMAAWLLARRRGESVGAAPGRVVGGVAALSQSERNIWTVTVERGNYALICLLADDGDGLSHLDHGHVQRFEVVDAKELIQPDSL